MAKRQAEGPQFVRYFGPVMNALKQLGGSARPAEVRDIIVEQLKISDAEQSQTLTSGESRFNNQVAWARFYLVKADYIDSSVRGVWSLTEKGREANLTQEQAVSLFKRIHQEFQDEESVSVSPTQSVIPQEAPAPDEDNYRSQLMTLLLEIPPEGFERLCQRLLRESGFERVTVSGRSGDGGIDGIGILQMNPFVSFKVLFRSKRYAGAVNVSQVRDFRGAMMGRADKGIILTTGTFTADARKEAVRDGVPPIELVDGEKILDMFESLQLGLKPKITYAINREFFDEFR